MRQAARAGESRVLYEIISTVGSSLDLDEVLEAVVDLLSEASAVHACFVYFLEDEGERLVLRAASAPYSHLVDEIALERGEGLAWWAAERGEPAFIRENALEDPRVKYVPELAETLARAETLDELAPEVADRSRRLLGARAAHLYLLEPRSEVLHLRASA